jgi:transposase
MTRFVGLDVSQKMTAICIIDNAGRRLWRGQCSSVPEQICDVVLRHAGDNVRIGIKTGAMTPWLVHELRNLGFEVVCLDARHARAALKMQINKTDQNGAEGLAQIVRTGWYRSVHVKSLDSHRARALPGARTQLVGMTTGLSNHIRGILKTFGLLPVRCGDCHLIGKLKHCFSIVPTLRSLSGPCSLLGGNCASRSLPSTRRSAYW